jgi:hypothetical protein
MSEHAKLSPSGSARWLACPGSYWLSEQAPKQPSTAAADEGTDAHDWAAKILLGELDAFDSPYAGIELYVDRVKQASERKGAMLWVEKRVYLTQEVHGTPDAVVSHKKVLDVFDLKYGYNKVEAKDNTQLLIYAAGAIKTYDLKPTKVNMHIVQPRAGGIRSAQLPIKVFWARVNTILDAADKLLANPDSPRHAGDHCQYCQAAPICPERKAEAKMAAEVAFTPVQQIDEDTMLWAIENKKRIIDWFEQLNTFAIEQPPRGYAVVQGQGRRVWRTDIEVPMILKAMTLSEAEKAGHNLDELTVKKPGPLTLVRKEVDASSFPDVE